MNDIALYAHDFDNFDPRERAIDVTYAVTALEMMQAEADDTGLDADLLDAGRRIHRIAWRNLTASLVSRPVAVEVRLAGEVGRFILQWTGKYGHFVATTDGGGVGWWSTLNHLKHGPAAASDAPDPVRFVLFERDGTVKARGWVDPKTRVAITPTEVPTA